MTAILEDLAPAHARLGHSEPRDYCWYCTETEKMTAAIRERYRADHATGKHDAIAMSPSFCEDCDDAAIVPCACGSTETVELSDERQSITLCANCGSDQ